MSLIDEGVDAVDGVGGFHVDGFQWVCHDADGVCDGESDSGVTVVNA